MAIGYTIGGFIEGILRGVRCTKSLRVLFLHRRPWTTLVLYSRAVFIFNEPTLYGRSVTNIISQHKVQVQGEGRGGQGNI
jgi:hypothetical protein